MAKDQSYQYLDLVNPILPYISYASPTDERARFIPGSQNIMASQIGYLEKRPGFSTRIGGDGGLGIAGPITRIFGWRRWNGSFFVMLSVQRSIGGNALVYKFEVGVDSAFAIIWTSAGTTPFDFVVSDNFCFFGNETDMRKFDGTTVSKWGCDAPPTAPTVSFLAGFLPPGIVAVGDTISGTPTQPGTSQITVTVMDSVGTQTQKTFTFNVQPADLLISTPPNLPAFSQGSPLSFPFASQFGTGPFTWSIFSGTLPPGLSLSSGGVLSGTPSAEGLYSFAIKVQDSTGASAVKSFNTYIQNNGTLALSPSSGVLPNTPEGLPYSTTITVSGGTAPYTVSTLPALGGTGLEPFTTLPQGFGISIAGSTITISGTSNVPADWTFDVLVKDSAGHSIVSIYSIDVISPTLTIVNSQLPTAYVGAAYSQQIIVQSGTPPYSFSYTAGTLDAQTGYVYGYTYTTIYGHESNMSPLSLSTGIFTGLDPTMIVTASADPQVNGINVYRTTDGGIADPAIMRLVASLPNTNQTFSDSTPDIFLGTQTGPGFLINTPPTPTRGFVWSNGRIYGMTLATVYYSGLEEVSNGIPEEAWPSGADGNYYAWPAQVGGMAVTENGVDIGLSEQFWQVSGDSLDTFRKSLLLDKAGVGSPTCINAIGNSVQWVDSAKQIWSSSLGEIGEAIRTDLTGLDPNQTFIGYHKSGNFNWIYVLDALAGRLYLYDLDTNQWYPPWTVAATAIWSGEIAVGQIALLVAIGRRVYQLTPGAYVDGPSAIYEDDIKTGLVPISPGRTTSARSRMQPTQLEELMFEQSAVDFEGTYPSFVGVLCDEDPVTADVGEWTDISANNVTPQFIPRKKKLMQYRYICDSQVDPALRVASWIQFQPEASQWKIYSLTLSWIKA